MSNSIASLLPVLIEDQSVPYLKTRGGLVNTIYTVHRQDNKKEGGQVDRITLPASRFTPVARDYSSGNSAQAITLPYVDITFNRNFINKISLNELEARISQGNQDRILRETINAMADGLLLMVEQDIASLYAQLPQINTVYNGALTDTVMRAGVATLMANRIDPKQNQVYWRGSSGQYMTDLMSIDRYVLALNNAQGIQGGTLPTISTGTIPGLYNMNVDWTAALPTFAMSGKTVQPSLMYEKYFAAVGFLEFQPVSVFSNGSAPVTETFTVDPDSGIRLRWQIYYDANLGQMYLTCDACWGYGLLDATRGVCINSDSAQ